MTPLKIETIQDKLFRINQNVTFIEDILRSPNEDILKDVARYNGLEHMLQLSIQAILDIGAHILAEEFQENPANYQDIIAALGKHGVIEQAFATEQVEMAKFRNKLIHDYDAVDTKKVLLYARTAPDIFRTFGKAFADFIAKK